MKKVILSTLLALFVVTPIFATDYNNFEIVPKIGYLIVPEVTVKDNGNSASSSKDSVFSFGADFFYNLQNNFFIGLGATSSQQGEFIKNSEVEAKIAFINFYVTAKYKRMVTTNEDDPCYIYPIINLGVGYPTYSVDNLSPGVDFDMETGFYWAAGLGVEYKNVIIEGLYGCNYTKFDLKNGSTNKSFDASYTTFKVNVGYKFALY